MIFKRYAKRMLYKWLYNGKLTWWQAFNARRYERYVMRKMRKANEKHAQYGR